MHGNAKLLKVYVGENERYKNKPLYQYLIKWLHEEKIAGVTITRGIEGYGQDKVVHTARLLELSADLPIVLEIVDTTENIEGILPQLCQLVPKGLIFTTDIFVHKYGK
ncbi:DUF190 domain-containing protein [Desulfitobacterium sp. Sab5]|uniref:DUF190 domain-containing protein n=1 Tax=Desulfitobacterium TaxID=36853 RepID=UPI003CE95903